MDSVATTRRTIVLSLLIALLAGLAVLSLPHANGASAVTTSYSTAHSQAARTAVRKAKIARSIAQPRTWGVTNAEMPWNDAAMSDLSVVAGRPADTVMWYVAWSLDSSFPLADADRVASWGAIPEITWEPWDPSAGVDQPQYSLANITSGAFDSYLTSWARAIQSYGRPIRIRFAHEMNGNWYPWAQGVNGNGAGSYVAAWRHVVGLFHTLGVTNITWIWSPNVPYPGSTDLADVFPGDHWVGQVDLDGYNWGTAQGGAWTSFAKVFGPGVAQLAALSTRPIGIGEVGCAEAGGVKSRWMHSMWKTLSRWHRVRSLTWFDFDKEQDWRIDSSPRSAAAFGAGLPGFLDV